MQALLDAIAAMPLSTEARRIFHGRGGLYPGCEQWVLDAYPPVFVLTSFAPATDTCLMAGSVRAAHRHGKRRALSRARAARAEPRPVPRHGRRPPLKVLAYRMPD